MNSKQLSMVVSRTLLGFFSVSLMVGTAHAQQGNKKIKGTRHNLSASGPGSFKATGSGSMCLFCHAPHRAEK